MSAESVMRPVLPFAFDESASRLRLRTIIRLRWIAVLGQAVTIAVVYLAFGFDMPIGLCALVIALSVWLNVYLRIRFPGRLWLKSVHATAMLAYDVLQLAALLYLTGGLQNPFAFLIVVPVTVSASTQPLRHTIVLALLAVVCASALTVYHEPLPWFPGETLKQPFLYTVGMWAAVVSGSIFLALYARRIAKEARQMSEALAATEAILLREQKLHALDGLAAAAAHGLGTPLSTISVVAKELLREVPGDSVYREDVELLQSQAEKCREILATLSGSADEPDLMFSRMPIGQLLEEAAEPHRVFEADIVVDARPGPDAEAGGDAAREPVSPRNPGVIYGLGNLIENAVDFAESRVDVHARWDGETVTIIIMDDGPGFAPPVRERLGEPYVTTRAGGGPKARRAGDGYGFGLGFFIAKTLLERTGATLALRNREPPERGAVVEVVWPRERIEASEPDSETAPV